MTQRPALGTPLTGIKVLDLSRILAGPWCTMTLGDMGAEIWKIEHPIGGDDTRGWGPPDVDGLATYFMTANRNKRSIAIDLRTPEGQGLVQDMAARADIVVENFRTGALVKYGLDAETLTAKYPGLIYCSISGYGRTGPRADEAGYDFVIQAESGMMAITGPVDGPPMKLGVAFVDVMAGMNAVQAILAALYARQQTGQGKIIDIALHDTALAGLANIATAHLNTGQDARRYGNQHPSIVPYQSFDTADGALALAIGNDAQFRTLCEKVLDCRHLTNDPRFRRNSDRVQHRDILIPQLAQIFATRGRDDWLGRLRREGLPCGPVRNVAEAFASPESHIRDMVIFCDEMFLAASPLGRIDPEIISRPPYLGADTGAVLAEIVGLSDAEIRILADKGIIALYAP